MPALWLAACLLCAAPAPEAASDSPPRVATFAGLLALEKDASVSDDEKRDQWQAFVTRTEQQLAYARQAVERWERAHAQRQLKRALALDEGSAPAADKIEAWEAVAEAFAGTDNATRAQKRARYWQRVRSQELVEAAQRVEAEGRSKVDRIAAWGRVLAWAQGADIVDPARARIAALQAQLVKEAIALDGVARVDDATKREAWQAVLDGRPSAAERRRAERRLRELAGR
jgi:hypothetical protein